ncbi:MAG: hypothetical protein QF477_12655 [SAR202 cluster bacterium]|jgi:hypothetical protein|nr:hypothetical protein [SAR202 cluster bacterium]MDP6664889.1 hypothetical protein [SAR202 cluster bacterium]MDP6799812.1 hypothetical protein [SAR202 cluster bacterium]
MFEKPFGKKWSPQKDFGSYLGQLIKSGARHCCGTPTADEARRDFNGATRARRQGYGW